MTSLHLVRPELLAFLEKWPITHVTAEILPQLRATLLAEPEQLHIPHLNVSERHIPGPDNAPPVRVIVYRPTNSSAAMPAILHMHGGGFVTGRPEMSDLINRQFAAEAGVVIVSVDYRLAPETPFPGPLEDCYAALKWLHTNVAELGIDPRRIAVKGESAGGGLAAGLALLARDRGEVSIVYQCLTYPMIDDRTAVDLHPYAGQFIWTAESNRFGWQCYLGREAGGPGISAYAAPARAENLENLPPTLIICAALDLFLEENLEYARRLTRAAVPVELLVYAGAYHGFQLSGDTQINRRYQHDWKTALLEALGHPYQPKAE